MMQMSLVSHYSVDEFTSEFPIDLGNGIRGELVSTVSGFEGIIICHIVGKYVCSVVVCTKSPANRPLLWGFHNKAPATITITGPVIECINCPEYHVGHVTDGKWIPGNV